MLSKIAKLGATLAAALATLAPGSDAGAANLNTHASAFRSYNAGQAELADYVSAGVRTGATGGLWVVAPVVRSPVNNTYQNFYIDGDNQTGSTTQFYLYSFDYLGNLESSVSFDSSATGYSIFATLDPISTYSYVSLLAILPGYYGGTVRGVTALD
jgi:hypothetical protein